MWTKTFVDSLNNETRCITQTKDYGFVFAITKTDTSNTGVYFVKTDSAGHLIWFQDFSNINELNDIKELGNKNLLMTGYTTSFGWGLGDIFMFITDSNGFYINGKTYGGYKFDDAYSVYPTSDSGYVILGTTESYGLGYSNIYLVKTIKNLTSGNSTDHIYFISEYKNSSDNGIYVYPNPASDILSIFVKNNIEGNVNILVYDIYGKVIYQTLSGQTEKGSIITIDLNNFSNGIYFLSLKTPEKQITRKIIINK